MKTSSACIYTVITTLPPPAGVPPPLRGYPDGINNQFYAAVPTYTIDMLGTWIVNISITFSSPNTTYTYSIGDKQMYVPYIVNANVSITKEKTDKDNVLFMYENIGNIGIAGTIL